MTQLVEKNGKKVILIEQEINLDDIDKHIRFYGNMVQNIDRNIRGFQQRREKLVTELNRITAIKVSLPKETGSIEDPA